MKRIQMINLIMAIAVGIFIWFPAFSQNLKMDDFDVDGNGKIEKSEFKEVFIENYWEDWDYTQESDLGDEDFYTSTFNMVDTNDDDLISPDEWDYGYGYYYDGEVTNDFEAYDLNKDDFISYAEYSDALHNKNYFSTWDTDYDSILSEEELSGQVFNNWDVNKDGVLDDSEFKKFDYFYSEF